MKIIKLIGNKFANAFYNLPRILFINFYRSFLRIRISDRKKIPRNHSVIFAFNHTTGADPIIALGALKRKIHFIADSERFTNRFTTFFMRRFANSTPIFKKEAQKNVRSFKELFLISRRKKIFFGIFPEGDLFKKGKFGKFHNGAAYLSFKTKIPIVPVYMHNINVGPTNESWVGRHPVFEGIASLFMNTYRRIHVFVGDPIDPMAENILEELSELTDKNEYKKVIDKITEELEKEFLELKEEALEKFSK
jgi:1-acyl-sn-glycerol-3-phosphate acyltransferase